MKKKWIESMGDIDDRFVEEADPAKPKVTKKKRLRTVLIVAACVCLLATAVTAAFVISYQFGDGAIAKYKDSPYYGVIQKLHALKQEQTENKNWGGIWDNSEKTDSIAPEAPEMDMEGTVNGVVGGATGERYEEITDNQVSGIIEGDLIKRSDRHVYYLAPSGMLYVYSIEGKDSKEVGSYKLQLDNSNEKFSASQFEMFLSADCKSLTVMVPVYNFDMGMDCLRVKQLDVSDPAKIKEKSEVTVSGQYVSSRMTNGDLLVITRYSLDWANVDFDDLTTCVPQVVTDSKSELVPAKNIIMPEKLTNKGYTVVVRLQGDSMETVGSGAFLSYSEDMYVSAENVYATRRFDKSETKGNLVTTKTYTEVSRLSYSEKDFEAKGSVTVEGYVKDRYSLDEYKGILRVVTTTSISQYRETEDGGYATNWNSNTSANLYCIKVDQMEVTAEKTGFAPSGETVQSVRYKADSAYVCTAVVFTDPVFFFDLSDLTNITYKETETIEGFSSSLVNFENGKLLGIGRTDWSTLKIEIYEEGEDDVVSVAKYELKEVSYATDYKAYYIDRENQLIGLGVQSYNKSVGEYIVLHFDGERLQVVANAQLGGNYNQQRGFYKDGFFYMCGNSDFKAVECSLDK